MSSTYRKISQLKFKPLSEKKFAKKNKIDCCYLHVAVIFKVTWIFSTNIQTIFLFILNLVFEVPKKNRNYNFFGMLLVNLLTSDTTSCAVLASNPVVNSSHIKIGDGNNNLEHKRTRCFIPNRKYGSLNSFLLKIYVHAHACTCMHMHAHACTCMHICVHMHAHSCICTHVHAHIYAYIYARTMCMHMRAHAWMCMHMYTHMHAHKFLIKNS